MTVRRRQRRIAVGRGENREAGALEVVAEDAHDLGLVVDD